MSLQVRSLFLAVAWLALEHVRPVTVELHGQRPVTAIWLRVRRPRRVFPSRFHRNRSRCPNLVHLRGLAAACRAGTDVPTSDDPKRLGFEGLDHGGALNGEYGSAGDFRRKLPRAFRPCLLPGRRLSPGATRLSALPSMRRHRKLFTGQTSDGTPYGHESWFLVKQSSRSPNTEILSHGSNPFSRREGRGPSGSFQSFHAHGLSHTSVTATGLVCGPARSYELACPTRSAGTRRKPTASSTYHCSDPRTRAPV